MKMDTAYILSLPLSIKQSLADYTGSDYEEINKKMREGGTLQGREVAKALSNFEDLDLAFRGAPEVQEPFYVYQGC